MNYQLTLWCPTRKKFRGRSIFINDKFQDIEDELNRDGINYTIRTRMSDKGIPQRAVFVNLLSLVETRGYRPTTGVKE